MIHAILQGWTDRMIGRAAEVEVKLWFGSMCPVARRQFYLYVRRSDRIRGRHLRIELTKKEALELFCELQHQLEHDDD
jgi:hypothetical protein